ncbi:hypothetical protein SLEP1_g20821 [Rubroshorea leprosula]|uniref:Uncharacterized protein n=1 Tax=Rubroshorea leprosula TaxID=152421 RepID=A0AAV5JD09_9ROSI|nr:hypothetical protein SLEP1_g20821 [Rubroshorea leprosula]
MLQRVSAATPCHGLGMYAANSCQVRLLGVPCRTSTCVHARAHAPVGAVAATPCHDGLNLDPRTHAP